MPQVSGTWGNALFREDKMIKTKLEIFSTGHYFSKSGNCNIETKIILPRQHIFCQTFTLFSHLLWCHFERCSRLSLLLFFSLRHIHISPVCSSFFRFVRSIQVFNSCVLLFNKQFITKDVILVQRYIYLCAITWIQVFI